MSRGLWFAMSARTRRSLTLLWTALFLCSLALQYVQLAVPAPVLAVHDDQFQLDGNAVDEGAGDDWGNHPGADAFTFVVDPVNSSLDRGFTGGGSKDDLNTSSWAWERATVTPDKDDITNAYAALYGNNLYFGADRFSNNGDAAQTVTVALPVGLKARRLTDALGGNAVAVRGGRVRIELPALSGRVLLTP